MIAVTQAIFPVIEAGDVDALRRLLDADPGLVHVRHADPKLHHFTALQFAAAKGQLAVCRLLVERDAEVYTNPMNSRNLKPDSEFYGMTPLIMNATQKDDCAEVTGLLIAAGADINATDATGKTALVHAQERGLARILDVLRRHGAA